MEYKYSKFFFFLLQAMYRPSVQTTTTTSWVPDSTTPMPFTTTTFGPEATTTEAMMELVREATNSAVRAVFDPEQGDGDQGPIDLAKLFNATSPITVEKEVYIHDGWVFTIPLILLSIQFGGFLLLKGYEWLVYDGPMEYDAYLVNHPWRARLRKFMEVTCPVVWSRGAEVRERRLAELNRQVIEDVLFLARALRDLEFGLDAKIMKLAERVEAGNLQACAIYACVRYLNR